MSRIGSWTEANEQRITSRGPLLSKDGLYEIKIAAVVKIIARVLDAPIQKVPQGFKCSLRVLAAESEEARDRMVGGNVGAVFCRSPALAHSSEPIR